MSSLPIREQIIRNLAARVGAVRRLEMYDERDLPITVLQEGDDQAAETGYDMTQVSMSISVARAAVALGPRARLVSVKCFSGSKTICKMRFKRSSRSRWYQR